ncbi:MAG: acetolactate synthase small subunit [Candidatus Neomarinimicrobiota bacterium]|nr:acetolactate synthase small subunit [Candidatus Neomarinimicrobiota bacterium]
MKHTYVALVRDTAGVLNQIVNQFRRRNINIESLAVAPCERPGLSRVTIVANDVEPARQDFFVQILKNIVYVVEVQLASNNSHIVRENVLAKINPPPQKRKEVKQLAHKSQGRLLQNGNSSMVFEAAGTAEEMDKLVNDLESFNIIELVRSGRVAISKQEKDPALSPNGAGESQDELSR